MNYDGLFGMESISVQDDVFNPDDTHGTKLGAKADPGDVVSTEPDEGDTTIVRSKEDPEDTVTTEPEVISKEGSEIEVDVMRLDTEQKQDGEDLEQHAEGIVDLAEDIDHAETIYDGIVEESGEKKAISFTAVESLNRVLKRINRRYSLSINSNLESISKESLNSRGRDIYNISLESIGEGIKNLWSKFIAFFANLIERFKMFFDKTSSRFRSLAKSFGELKGMIVKNDGIADKSVRFVLPLEVRRSVPVANGGGVEDMMRYLDALNSLNKWHKKAAIAVQSFSDATKNISVKTTLTVDDSVGKDLKSIVGKYNTLLPYSLEAATYERGATGEYYEFEVKPNTFEIQDVPCTGAFGHELSVLLDKALGSFKEAEANYQEMSKLMNRVKSNLEHTRNFRDSMSENGEEAALRKTYGNIISMTQDTWTTFSSLTKALANMNIDGGKCFIAYSLGTIRESKKKDNEDWYK